MTSATDRKWRAIAKSQLALRGVTSGTGFGRTEGLRVSGKIFAMFVKGDLVVKLPRARVVELAASGLGHPFDPGHGRLMKEWIAVNPGAARQWPSLVAEARAFVAAAGKPRSKSARKR